MHGAWCMTHRGYASLSWKWQGIDYISWQCSSQPWVRPSCSKTSNLLSQQTPSEKNFQGSLKHKYSTLYIHVVLYNTVSRILVKMRNASSCSEMKIRHKSTSCWLQAPSWCLRLNSPMLLVACPTRIQTPFTAETVPRQSGQPSTLFFRVFWGTGDPETGFGSHFRYLTVEGDGIKIVWFDFGSRQGRKWGRLGQIAGRGACMIRSAGKYRWIAFFPFRFNYYFPPLWWSLEIDQYRSAQCRAFGNTLTWHQLCDQDPYKQIETRKLKWCKYCSLLWCVVDYSTWDVSTRYYLHTLISSYF